jgi:hypothetical protein
MKFKTAVFTAEHGYKWTTPPEGVSETQLAQYGQIVDRVYCDGMRAKEDYVQGLAVDGMTIVAFSALRTPPGWDTAGRAAKYYAVAFVPKEHWTNVDFDALLRSRFFLQPDKDPPREIEYAGPRSAKVGQSVRESFANDGDGPDQMDFNCLGDFLADPSTRGKRWRFYRSNIPNWRGKKIEFEKGTVLVSMSKDRAGGRVSTRAADQTGGRVSSRAEDFDALEADTKDLRQKMADGKRSIEEHAHQIAELTRRVSQLTWCVYALLGMVAILSAVIVLRVTGIL